MKFDARMAETVDIKEKTMSEDVSPKPPIPSSYIGDGVYASFDGYQIWLHLHDHRSPGLIALEPSVYESLRHYAQRIWGAKA